MCFLWKVKVQLIYGLQVETLFNIKHILLDCYAFNASKLLFYLVRSHKDLFNKIFPES